MSARDTRRPRPRGMTVVEAMVALAVLVVGLLAVISVNMAAMEQVTETRAGAIARFAVATARDAISNAQFRKLTSVDTGYFLYGKGAGANTYPIAWNADGSAFQMPNCTGTFGTTYNVSGTAAATGATSPYAATVDGVAGCICVEFPVPGLVTPTGRIQPGRIVFYLSEAGQPATVPTAAFPFPPSPGLTKLDCDGDGAATTTDLRSGDLTAAHPFQIIPVRISVDWRTGPTAGAVESYTEYFLLSFHGYD